MLSRIMTMLFHRQPIDNTQEIEAVKRESRHATQTIKNQAIARSNRTAKQFEQTTKKVYDIAEQIHIATGRHR